MTRSPAAPALWLVALLALAALASAGCTSSPPAAATPSPTASAPIVLAPVGKLTVASDVLVAEPGFAEPNIEAAPDGSALYIANPGQVWRSVDGGASWTEGSSPDGGGDGDITVGPDGRLHYLGLFGDAGAIPYSVSDDGGASWSKAVDLSGGTGNDREWITAGAGGQLYTTWRGNAGLEFRASLDGGVTWEKKTVVGPDGDEGRIAVDPLSGEVAISVVDLGPLTGTTQPVVHVYTSSDDGASWATHDVRTLPRTTPAEPNGYNSDFPVVAYDAAGTMYLAYSSDATVPANVPAPTPVVPPEEASLFGIFLQTSDDHGSTWSEPRLLSTAGKSARFPWLEAGAAGRVAVAWYENVNGVPSELLPDQWNVILVESGNADTATPTFERIQVTPQPSHLGAVCTSGTGCLAADRSLLDFFELDIDADGQVVIAYASSVLGTGLGVGVQATTIHAAKVTGAPLAAPLAS